MEKVRCQEEKKKKKKKKKKFQEDKVQERMSNMSRMNGKEEVEER